MSSQMQYEEMRRLGLLGLLPLAIPALAVWMAPWALPMGFALDLHQMALAYAGVIAAYLAGISAGGALTAPGRNSERLVAGIAVVLVVWIAVWQGGLFRFTLGAAWRYALVIGALVYLWLRDRRAVVEGALPGWYGALRARLTFWACLCLLAIMSRLMLWGYY